MKFPPTFTVACPRCGVDVMVGVTDLHTSVMPDRIVVTIGTAEPRHRCADLETLGATP